MALQILSRLSELVPVRAKCYTTTFRLNSSGGLKVEHDRQNRRFTVSPRSGTGAKETATLLYKFTAPNQVELLSTFVPESFRGQGVAALLSKAAFDFLLEEKLKARVSCWYIKKYIEANPRQDYKDVVIS
ncbi:protein NATD1-like [Dunckerocampus dactyliophorus]|uniref:protein NATD1-like n=1 Tax=Dunckerocampus dactyliophorus TaxID=161453 RepID=UPI002405A136|nr:protein NATD1-like [Dunckerocampus dactyliophorus]